MRLFEILDVDEETPVAYVGVYVMHWQPEWGEPTVMFREVEDPLLEAAPELLAALERAEQTLRNLIHGFIGGDATAIMENELRNIQRAIAKARGES